MFHRLQLFRILTDVQGIAGAVVEARVRHDAFVLNKKKDAIVVHMSQSPSPDPDPDPEDTPSVTLNKSTTSIVKDATETLTATTVPDGETVTWTSSDDETATVTSGGVVTGVKAGTATITATITVDGTDYTDTCAVTITAE